MSQLLIIRSKLRLPLLAADRTENFPVMRLQTAVLFPENMQTIRVRRPESLRLLDDCDGCEFIASYSPARKSEKGHGRIHQVGVFARIRDVREDIEGSRMVTIEGIRRAVIDSIEEEEPYLLATASEVACPDADDKVVHARADAVLSVIADLVSVDPSYSLETLQLLKMYRGNPDYLADQVAAAFHFPLDTKQALLDAVGLRLRYERLLRYLNVELERATTRKTTVREMTSEKSDKTAVEQSPTSGDSIETDPAPVSEAQRIKSFIRTVTNLPPEVVSRITIEADRLARLSPASAEYGQTKHYIDWILALPWGKAEPEDFDMKRVAKVISGEYYGPKAVKEQILQRLAVRRLLKGADEGPTLCLVGAPGTGKASLAKAIAKAVGKQLIRISVGGITDISEIKGTPRALLGATPGKIVSALKEANACNPIVLIEDIDYFNVDNDAAVNQALLEVVDTRLNQRFWDDYLGLSFDLSKILFICTVRSPEEIPEQFIPRFELLELPGYIEREKVAIAKRQVIPRLLKKHGILKSELRISDRTILRIINDYTQEAGLLGLSQQIEKICRRVALEKVEKKRRTWTIPESNLTSYLGPAYFIPEKAGALPEIGVATGLAWTGSGGDLMFIEGLKMKGEGRIATTGSLGEVMKESIQAAHSYVRSKADMLGIDFQDFNEFDLHIHFPSGAIPKDGPSAGVTVCLVVASIMSERPIRNDIAMTGEVTLRGRVLPVGGIKEKVSAAFRTGIHHVALPKENEKDTKELPKEVLRKMKFTYIERVDELFELCLMDFTPSSFTLEKVFAEEIAKAKKKAKKPTKSKKSPRGKAARPKKD